jgi:hypothetical protein
MRTKTLLLSAVAVAAGILSSQAQSNVFSANVVGYVSVVLPGNGQYQLVANPFDDGAGNYVTNVLNQALPKQSQVLIWNGSGYDIVSKVGTPANFPPGTTNQVPPGIGFFVKNGSAAASSPAITNVFVGSIVIPNGGSVTNNLPIGFTLAGSPVPYSGFLAHVGSNDGDTNMNFGGPLTKQSQILTWDSVAQGYNIVSKVGTPALWNGDSSANPGQAFFVKNANGPATNVVETLNLQ